MKKDNPLKDKSYAFAVRIVYMYKYLCDKKHEYVLSKQVLRLARLGSHSELFG